MALQLGQESTTAHASHVPGGSLALPTAAQSGALGSAEIVCVQSTKLRSPTATAASLVVLAMRKAESALSAVNCAESAALARLHARPSVLTALQGWLQRTRELAPARCVVVENGPVVVPVNVAYAWLAALPRHLPHPQLAVALFALRELSRDQETVCVPAARRERPTLTVTLQANASSARLARLRPRNPQCAHRALLERQTLI